MSQPALRRRKRRVKLALIGLPLLISAFIFGGAFSGFYLGATLGLGRFILPFLLSTTGFALSLVLSYLIARKAAED